MLKKTQAFGAAVLCALAASAACSSSSSDDSGSAGTMTGGGGGNSGGAGRGGGGAGGRAGSSGSAGKAGSSSSAGKGGTSGSTAGGGEGGEGGSPACPGCASGFCLTDGTCVDCLASNDHCPDNQYCTDTNTCAPGCKADGSNCASGVCTEQHDCKNCIGDDECSAGHVCGGGVCAAACTAAQEGSSNGCSGSLTCCSSHCVDTQTDSTHCGACGTACGTSQFCGITACADPGSAGAGGAAGDSCVACDDTVLANLCAISKVIVISDTGDPDSTPPPKNSTDGNLIPARAIGAALNAQCPSQPTVTEERQDTPDALNITTGHPVSGGGTLLLVAGGPFFQNLENYFEQSASPLYVTNDGTTNEFIDRAGTAVASDPISIPGDPNHVMHDKFIVQFMRDASSGSLVLNAQGFWQSGTTAAAFEVANVILPSLSTYTKNWYAFDWTDANADQLPQANEITQIAAAP